ncbi:MAG TPA: hypothetical protein PLU87_04340, partial [Sedimentisphaerales bacterium]|nr:hypothetical protein [Sedimentisphaerales bacterium]
MTEYGCHASRGRSGTDDHIRAFLANDAKTPEEYSNDAQRMLPIAFADDMHFAGFAQGIPDHIDSGDPADSLAGPDLGDLQKLTEVPSCRGHQTNPPLLLGRHGAKLPMIQQLAVLLLEDPRDVL